MSHFDQIWHNTMNPLPQWLVRYKLEGDDDVITTKLRNTTMPSFETAKERIQLGWIPEVTILTIEAV